MDLVYASIGTAIEVTGSESNSGVWMPVAAAAASYYAITGPDATASRLAQVMSSSSYDLLKRVSGLYMECVHFLINILSSCNNLSFLFSDYFDIFL